MLATKQTQIIHFIGGYKRTIKGIIDIWENEMTHLLTDRGIEWIINKNNVLAVEKLTDNSVNKVIREYEPEVKNGSAK